MVETVTIIGTPTQDFTVSPGARTGGNTASLRRGDPHGPGRERFNRTEEQRQRAQERLFGSPLPPTTGGGDDLPTVTVTGTQDGNTTNEPLPGVGVGYPGSVPFNDPNISPVRPTPEPRETPLERAERLYPDTPAEKPKQSFLAPEPAELPEVRVEAKRPPPFRPPGLDLFGLSGLLGAGIAGVLGRVLFAFRPNFANVGERERVNEMLRDDLISRLLPVTPSVERLADPLPEVTVTAPRLSDTAAPRATPRVSRAPFAEPRLFPVRVTVPQPPRTRPARQTLPRGATAPTRSVTIVGSSAGPALSPFPLPRPSRSPNVPRPTAPNVPSITIPGSPVGPGPIAGLTPIAGLDPGTGLSPNPGSLFSGVTPPKTCTCAPSKPRKPRTPRLECREGTYVETRTGLIKRPSRKVPCR